MLRQRQLGRVRPSLDLSLVRAAHTARSPPEPQWSGCRVPRVEHRLNLFFSSGSSQAPGPAQPILLRRSRWRRRRYTAIILLHHPRVVRATVAPLPLRHADLLESYARARDRLFLADHFLVGWHCGLRSCLCRRKHRQNRQGDHRRFPYSEPVFPHNTVRRWQARAVRVPLTHASRTQASPASRFASENPPRSPVPTAARDPR